MKYQWVGINISLLIHGVIIVLIFAVSQTVSPKHKIIVIDFSIVEGSKSGYTSTGGKPGQAVLQKGKAAGDRLKNIRQTKMRPAMKEQPVEKPRQPALKTTPAPNIARLPETPEPAIQDSTPKPLKPPPPKQVAKPAPKKVIKKITRKILDPKPVSSSKKKIKVVKEIRAAPVPVPQPVNKAKFPENNFHRKPSPVTSIPIKAKRGDQLAKFEESTAPGTAQVSGKSSPGPTGNRRSSTRRERGTGWKEKGAHLHSSKGTGTGAGSGRSDVNTNYNFIRDRLREKLIYPKVARMRGWSGKVLVSFTLLLNGNVDNIKIVKSCGVAVLDKSAVKTVENASPFQKPPKVAKIIIPVVYKLQ